MTRAFKHVLMSLIIAGIITVYTVRSFYPQQPIHHELNDAGGVLVTALILTWIFA